MKKPPIDLQEQILIVLAYHEQESTLVEALVPADLFEGHYLEIAKRLIDYRRKYSEVPGTGIFSLFSDLQESEAWETYRLTLTQLEENKERVAPKFVVDQLAGFVRRQNLRLKVLEAYEMLQDRDDDDALASVETSLVRACQEQVAVFDPGIRFDDVYRAWGQEESEVEDAVMTGIRQIDSKALGPRRGQLSLLVAPSKTGKSWWGVHLTKMAAVTQRKSVLFVTLEISSEEVMRRLHSSMFAIRRGSGRSQVTLFKKDRTGRVLEIETREGHTGLYVGDEDFYQSVEKQVQLWKKTKVIVKEFPSGTLTVPMLDAYLTHLASHEGFRPDMVVVDYADLMKASSDNLRLELERLFVDLRGLSQQRNFALVTMSQANRRGAESKSGVDVHHVAESWAKVATADTILTLSRSPEEERRGLARLKVAASRVAQDGFQVLISQDYAHGQFVVDQAQSMDISGMLEAEGA